MTTRELTQVALMGTLLYIVFHAFSDILYLELITFTILAFSQVFSRRDIVLACILFASLHMLLHGIMIWNISYLLIFPIYGFIFASMKRILQGHLTRMAVIAGIFSFLIGQLVDFPFILFSKTITVLYLLIGIKTSLIQGILTFLVTLFLYEPIHAVLCRVKKLH